MFKAKWMVATLMGGVLLGGSVHGVGAQSFTPTPLAQVSAFFGTGQVKLIFKAHGEGLYLVDYSQPQGDQPTVRLLPNTLNASFPVISPDGNYVAYTTGTVDDEFTRTAMVPWLRSLTSDQVYQVAPLGYVPRFVQDETVVKVLYATASKHPTPSKYTFEGAGKMVVATFTGAAFTYDTLWHGGVMLGGLSRDGRYMGHGQQAFYSFILDLQNSSNLPFAMHCLEGGAPGQVCNTSISSSHYYPNMLLYFDTGAKAALAPAALGGPWGNHKRLFISRSDGAIVRYFDLPAEIRPDFQASGLIANAEWNFPEWSNHPYFAVTTIKATRKWDVGGNWNSISYIRNERLYGVNFHDSLYLQLALANDTTSSSTANYLNPWMWVGSGAPAEAPGWLEGERYMPASACVIPGVTDIPEDTTPPVPPKPAENKDDNDGPCGRGAVGALLPPLFFKLWPRRKKARLNS
jgi:hypothetical protein